MKTHKEYLDKQLSDKKFADRFYREKRKLKMNKEYAEKVNAMTDEELRIKAAELMGDEREYLCCEDLFCPPTVCIYGEEDVYNCIHLRDGGDVNDCPEMSRGDLPDYPRDIAAAWKLVDALKDRELYPEVQNVGLHGYLWNVWLDFPGETDSALVAQDENVKRAITKAFILAMEAND